jgi:hypothetical protein
LNFKGVQTFLEKSDKFSKIPYPHPILDYKFTLAHLYSKIGSSFTSGKKDLVQIISKILHFNLSDMHSVTFKIQEDMAFQK